MYSSYIWLLLPRAESTIWITNLPPRPLPEKFLKCVKLIYSEGYLCAKKITCFDVKNEQTNTLLLIYNISQEVKELEIGFHLIKFNYINVVGKINAEPDVIQTNTDKIITNTQY